MSTATKQGRGSCRKCPIPSACHRLLPNPRPGAEMASVKHGFIAPRKVAVKTPPSWPVQPVDLFGSWSTRRRQSTCRFGEMDKAPSNLRPLIRIPRPPPSQGSIGRQVNARTAGQGTKWGSECGERKIDAITHPDRRAGAVYSPGWRPPVSSQARARVVRSPRDPGLRGFWPVPFKLAPKRAAPTSRSQS